MIFKVDYASAKMRTKCTILPDRMFAKDAKDRQRKDEHGRKQALFQDLVDSISLVLL